MKLITCIIRSERLTAVKEALFRAGVTGITLSRVSGHGGERDFVRQYRTNDVVLEFHDDRSDRLGGANRRGRRRKDLRAGTRSSRTHPHG